MKVSKNWLQTYFKETIPDSEKLSDLFTFHSFEVEGVEKTAADAILDVKILPDRAHYALSHKGVAREIAFLTGLQFTVPKFPEISQNKLLPDAGLDIQVQDTDACPRYIGRVVENITVTDSPTWLKERLESVGQRSINSIVDATNFVMLDIGQPLHAFDKDKVQGNIVVRKAHEGEKITILDGKEITLTSSMLVIADNAGPLAIAGVKGGIRAQVTKETKSIILEAANFHASSVRMTSTKTNIKNDSSKRFENGISPVMAEWGMERVSALISELTQNATFGKIIDRYAKPQAITTIKITPEFISKMLGTTISESEITKILESMNIKVEKSGSELVLTIPAIRLDLVISEDIVEEVGRIYGYDKITPTLPPKIAGAAKINKTFYYSEKIKSLLIDKGFSEVFTYSLSNKGEIEILNPGASDKGFLRPDLISGMTQALEFNTRNADFLEIDQVKIFEIGKIFTQNKESLSLSIGIQNAKKLKKKEEQELTEIIELLNKELEIKLEYVFNKSKNIVEINLDAVIEKLSDINVWNLPEIKSADNKYQKISVFPFAVRDIAVFTPEGTSEQAVRDIIESHAGTILVKNRLFDVFTKQQEDGSKKTSYAFRLVFQSHEKTLTEEEINDIMSKITSTMNAKDGWKVR